MSYRLELLSNRGSLEIVWPFSDLLLNLKGANAHKSADDNQSTKTLHGADLVLENHDICHESVDDNYVTDEADITCFSIFECLSQTDTTEDFNYTEDGQVAVDSFVLSKDLAGTLHVNVQ